MLIIVTYMQLRIPIPIYSVQLIYQSRLIMRGMAVVILHFRVAGGPNKHRTKNYSLCIYCWLNKSQRQRQTYSNSIKERATCQQYIFSQLHVTQIRSDHFLFLFNTYRVYLYNRR